MSVAQQCNPCDTAGAQGESLYADCRHEVARFRWIESEKAGRDLGESVVYRWIADHWWGYLRARWLEHMHGTRFWIELSHCEYGLLKRSFLDQKPLVNSIVELLKQRKENLDIIVWSKNTHAPDEIVHNILLLLDINASRLVHELEMQR